MDLRTRRPVTLLNYERGIILGYLTIVIINRVEKVLTAASKFRMGIHVNVFDP